MLPPFLQSSYKRYKQDTDIVATWLAVKSKELGYTIDAEACHKTTSTSGRLKGKARKQEKEKEKAAQTASNPAGKPCYVVKIKDFVPLAEFLVAYTKPIIKVPVALAKALDRAIALRTQRNEYSRQLTSQEGKEIQLDSDVTHSYFLSVLERVREVLRPRMTVLPAADPGPQHAKRSFPADSSDAEEKEQITNRFQMLDLEEPSQAFLNAPGIAPQPRVQPPVKPLYEAEVDQSLEEQCMASFCLFEDIGLIRSYIRHIWEEYKHQRLDLISVAVTTNTAICLVRDMEEDFVKRFPGIDGNTGFKETVQTLFQLRCCLRGENPEIRERADDSMNFKIYDLAEEYLVTTWQMMTSLWDSSEPGKVLIYEPIEDRDWELDWDNMTPRQKFKEDYYNLMEGLPDLVQIAIKGQAPLSEDEIIRGLRDVAEKETTNIPLWLVFAFKCFLEVQHTMKGEVGRGYEQLKRTAIAMKTSMTETVNLHKSPQLPRWPKDTLSEFNAMYGAIEIWVVQDFVQVQRKTLIKDTGIRNVPHALLKRHPMLSGLFEFALKARFQELGIAFVNHWKSIVSAAHLYNALRQEKLLGRPWKDMEIAIMFQGCEAFFVGNKPSNVGEYERRFMLRAGISSAAYASNRRTNVDPIRTKKKKVSRSLKEMTPLSKLFASRYFRNERSLLLTPESIKPIIEAKMAKKDREVTKESNPRSTRATQGPEAVKPGKVTKITDECSSALMSAVNFLEDIAMALSAEAPEFSLDYLGLHRTCWPLLEHVNEKCGPTLVEIFGPIPIEKYVFLGLLPVFIFSSATEGSIIGAPLQRTDEPSDQVLRLAAKAIEEFFKDGGDDRQAKALEQVHGQRVHVDHFAGEDIKNEAAKKDVPIAKDVPTAKDVPVAKKDVADAGKDMAWAQGSKVRSKILSAFE